MVMPVNRWVYFLIILSLSPFHINRCFSEDHLSIQALASLVFHTQQWKRQFMPEESTDPTIVFSEDEIARLWDRAADYLNQTPLETLATSSQSFEKAYQYYYRAKDFALEGQHEKAQQSVASAYHRLLALWERMVEMDEPPCESFSLFSRNQRHSNLGDYRYIPFTIREKIRPYLIPFNHPMKSRLDDIFLRARVTANRNAFLAAGFTTIAQRPRSFVHVASHPTLSGYLVKVYLDSELRKKRNRAGWEWFVLRCQGARKVQSVIKKYRIKHFTVAKKWIYLLPAKPSPPTDQQYTRQWAVLLVTDMNLTSSHLNHEAWIHSITTKHLDELYTIISQAKGSSYRPDNIAYTREGLFAFIDTEYPSKGPDFDSIRPYLSPKMRHYWDLLVRYGGK